MKFLQQIFESKNPHQITYLNDVEKLLPILQQVKGGTYSDDSWYDYSNGHITAFRTYKIPTVIVFPKKIQSELRQSDISVNVGVMISTRRGIGERRELDLEEFEIYVSGENYRNFSTGGVVEKKTDIKKYISEFIKKSQKGLSKPVDDITHRMISLWKSTSRKEKTVGSDDIGIGRHASTYIHKESDSIYDIGWLLSIFKNKKKSIEETVTKHYLFKKAKLYWDWDEKLLYKNSKYTEHWD